MGFKDIDKHQHATSEWKLKNHNEKLVAKLETTFCKVQTNEIN